ncbi:helix-turn-helix domain-containing protein [Micromonospora deserti]|uniref:helix-turn-helix domain-containing protein n=1 Tax=Micromonospora deserti TaxID=2070366 RepID=UPI0018F40A51|nr:helix-turn-helix domain-containing protein [Micromonospora deserti]
MTRRVGRACDDSPDAPLQARRQEAQADPRQQAELVRMRASGEYSIADLMEMFSVGRATVYRVLERAGHDGASWRT